MSTRHSERSFTPACTSGVLGEGGEQASHHRAGLRALVLLHALGELGHPRTERGGRAGRSRRRQRRGGPREIRLGETPGKDMQGGPERGGVGRRGKGGGVFRARPGGRGGAACAGGAASSSGPGPGAGGVRLAPEASTVRPSRATSAARAPRSVPPDAAAPRGRGRK